MTYETIQNIGKLVEITFVDVTEYDTNTCLDLYPIQCKTIGWLEEQNSSFTRISWLKECKDEPYVGLVIPNGCVQFIEEVRIR